MSDLSVSFSIILPCYNVTDYLGSCLDSIFANSVAGSEIILIDDGSTDGFRRCVQDYFSRDIDADVCRFFYKQAAVIIVSIPNSGVSSARNRGIAESTKDYLLFVDPDDTVSPDWLSTLGSHLAEQPTELCLFGFLTIEGNKSKVTVPHRAYNLTGRQETVDILLPRFLGKTLEQTRNWAKTGKFTPFSEFGAVWRVAYRRSLITTHNVRFNETISLNEDSMFNAWCAAFATSVSSLDSCLYSYYIRSGGAMTRLLKDGTRLISNKSALLEERAKILDLLKAEGLPADDQWIYGSVVFSILELMVKIPGKDYGFLRNAYLQKPLVKATVKAMPFVGKLKFDIPLLFMKLGLYRILFVLISLAAKAGFSV